MDEYEKAQKKVEWDDRFIKQLSDWLGSKGRIFFQNIIDKYGHLNVVLPGKGVPHPVHMREGMSVRNAMRDIHTAIGHPHESAHWYDNQWQSAVKQCLGIPTICFKCNDSGDSFVLRGGRYDKIPCPECQ